MTPVKDQRQSAQQAQRALARARRRQLDLAMRGQVAESGRFAHRARKIQVVADRWPRLMATDPS
jgi:hypothetical protein